MKILYKNKMTGFVLLCLILSGCTKDFVDINTNPNASAAAGPQSLLAPTLVAIINGNLGRNVRINNEFMQVTVTTADSREFHRYEVKPSESDYMWRNWYLNLTDIRDIYKNAQETQQLGYQTFKGISLILDAWVGSQLTDMFGDVPYSESNMGRDKNIAPKFDAQKDIYAQMFSKLEEADTLLKLNVNIPTEYEYSDPIFKGSASKWRRFGNSLYLRLLLRVAHKTELNAQAKIKEIVNDNPAQYPIMVHDSTSAILKFSGIVPFQTAFSNSRDFDFNGDKGYSEFFINNLVDLKDPRLPIWATQASLGVYGGMQSGYKQGNIPDRQSTLPLSLKNEPLLGNMMNYAELQFILAEAALKGYITGDVKTYYENGVKASMAMWGTTIDSTYFTNPAADINADNTPDSQLKKIQLQKYFSLLFTDFQQWYEYRRTKSLDLYVGPGLQNGGKMPSRMVYPTLVQTLNYENYNQAVAAMGGNGINQKVWWEK